MEIFTGSYLLPITAPPIQGGGIAVENGRIVDIALLSDLKKRYDAPVTEFQDAVIIPGLVNAHSHLELTHFSSWKLRKGIDYSPRTYVDWIIQVIKIRRGLTREELEHSVRKGIRILLESGTTSIGEILTDNHLSHLYTSSSLGGRLYHELIGHDPLRINQQIDEVETSIARFPAGSFLAGISPHAAYTLSQTYMKEAAALSKRRNLPVAIHLAESREETVFMHDSTGKIADMLYPFVDWQRFLPAPRLASSVDYLDSVGILGPDTMVVHAVHVTPSDVEIMKRREVSAVLCPRSNDRLDVGKAPAALLKKAGILLALGTDSLASNDSLSLWDEMRFACHEYPGVFTYADILRMATIGGAKALKIDHDAGSLEKGKRADFVAVDISGKAAVEALPEILIETGQVRNVFIGGKRIT